MKSLAKQFLPWMCVAALVGGAVWTLTVDADSGSGTNHQVKQVGAIELGTSGGNRNDIDTFCCGGTLGFMVNKSGTNFIVSNNHVFARSNQAQLGEPIIHPGLIDVGCNASAANNIAQLSEFQQLSFTGPNLVDAAIAQVVTGAVATDGAIMDIGPIAAAWQNGADWSTTNYGANYGGLIGSPVQKSGRTTGQTFGQVDSIDNTVSVKYLTKCAPGGKGNTATFTHQIFVTPGDFSAGGDSGSGILTLDNQRVGLLFAGSSSHTVANPIGAVLNAFGVSVVTGAPPDTGSISGTVRDGVSGIEGATVTLSNGQSTQTGTNGSYSFTSVPVATYDVTASKAGYNSSTASSQQVNKTLDTVVDFTLTALSTAGTSRVKCVIYSTRGGPNKNMHLDVRVEVLDGNGLPVSGATVSAALHWSGTTTNFGGQTDTSGGVTFTLLKAPDTCYTLEVSNIVAAGLTYSGLVPVNSYQKAPGADVDSDCEGDTPDSNSCSSGNSISLGPGGARNLQAAVAVKRMHEKGLFASSADVVGVGVSARNGEPVIQVYLKNGDQQAFEHLPRRVMNVPVIPVVTGEFVAGGWGTRPGEDVAVGGSCKQ